MTIVGHLLTLGLQAGLGMVKVMEVKVMVSQGRMHYLSCISRSNVEGEEEGQGGGINAQLSYQLPW